MRRWSIAAAAILLLAAAAAALVPWLQERHLAALPLAELERRANRRRTTGRRAQRSAARRGSQV